MRAYRLRGACATVFSNQRLKILAPALAQLQPYSRGGVSFRAHMSTSTARAVDSSLSLPSVSVGTGSWDGLTAYREQEQDMGWKWGEKGIVANCRINITRMYCI
jgi:hypothetical protein